MGSVGAEVAEVESRERRGVVDAENAEDAEVVGAVDVEDVEEFRGKFCFSDPTFFVLVNSNIFFVLVIVFGNEL